MKVLARTLRKRLTDAEQKLWSHIRKRQLMGFKFRRQAPIGKYIVDFVCFEQRLVIELDGGHHGVNQDYDHCRSEWLRSQGFKVLRFWNHDVMNSVEEIKEVIARHLLTPHPDLPPQGGKEISRKYAPEPNVGKDQWCKRGLGGVQTNPLDYVKSGKEERECF